MKDKRRKILINELRKQIKTLEQKNKILLQEKEMLSERYDNLYNEFEMMSAEHDKKMELYKESIVKARNIQIEYKKLLKSIRQEKKIYDNKMRDLFKK